MIDPPKLHSPSAISLFRAMRRIVAMRKLAGGSLMVNNLDILEHFHSEYAGVQHDTGALAEGRRFLLFSEWEAVIHRNMDLLVQCELLSYELEYQAPREASTTSYPRLVREGWQLTRFAIELISLLKTDEAIDDAVSFRLRGLRDEGM